MFSLIYLAFPFPLRDSTLQIWPLYIPLQSHDPQEPELSATYFAMS